MQIIELWAWVAVYWPSHCLIFLQDRGLVDFLQLAQFWCGDLICIFEHHLHFILCWGHDELYICLRDALTCNFSTLSYMRTGWRIVGRLHAKVILCCCVCTLILVLWFLLLQHLLTYLPASTLLHLVDLLVDRPSITLLVQRAFSRESHSSWVIVGEGGLWRLQVSSIRHQLTFLVAWGGRADRVRRALCLIASLSVVGGCGVRLFKHGIIDTFRHSTCKYLHLLCMGIWTLEDTNGTITQSLVLVAPKSCILLIFLLLVNDHNTILLQNLIIIVIVLFIGLSKRVV